MSNQTLFDNGITLPDAPIKKRSEALIGFNNRFDRIFNNLRLLIDQESLADWSKKHYHRELPVLATIAERYPLILMVGDAGTGKTVTAEAIADRMTRELKREGYFLKLSTRVRGEGLHGQMTGLVNASFEKIKQEAGKKKLSFLFIDEADAIATSRSTMQMHQEEKAAVNTLIQKIDEIRELRGRAVVFMSTNRLHFIDEAIIRRAAIVMEFNRPDEAERKELFTKSLEGTGLSDEAMNELAALTGPEKNEDLGYSFSDISLKILPEVVALCYPDKRISLEEIKIVINKVKPSPKII